MEDEVQWEEVLGYMKEHGGITSMDAYREFNITRLSAIIWILRHKKCYDIESIPMQSKRGKPFAKYVFKKAESNS